MTLADAPAAAPGDPRSLEDHVADTVGGLNVASAELVALVSEALATGAWEGAGIRSPEHWVAWRCGVSGARAGRLVSVARGLEALPACRALFEAGSLSEDQVAVIVRHTDADHDEQVAALAPSLTVTQLQRVLPSLPHPEPDPESEDDDDDERGPGEPEGRRRRQVRFAYGDDGTWWCSIRLPTDEGACRVPGCGYSRWLHVHHLVHWEHGGPTDPDNLLCLCPVHHRMVHKGLLTMEGDPTDPDGLVFTDNRGRQLTPAHPRPPGPGDPRPAGDWRHPPGERLNPYWISWN